MAALVVAAAGLGQILADIPAGAVVHRYGERPTMIGAAGLTVLALLGCIFAPNLAVFTASIFITGIGTAVWLLARQAYVAAVVPFRLRARAMSTLGGVYRIGLFVGPFVGGAVVAVTGLWGAYAVHIIAAVVAAGVLMMVKDLSETTGKPTGRAVRIAPCARGSPAAFGAVHAGHGGPGDQRRPRHPAGRDSALGPASRAVADHDLADLRRVRRGGHAAVLSGRQGDGPLRPAVGGRSVLDGARVRRWRWCRSPIPP